MRAKFINEIKQNTGKSGLGSLGIGKEAIKAKIFKWLFDYDILEFSLNEDLSINVADDVILEFYDIHKLPDYIQFGIIGGNFNISSTKLTTLRGCPTKVKKTFDCSNNKLASLEGGPRIVNVAYRCHHNNLTSLKGCAKIVGGTFQCDNNELTSLEGGPKKTKYPYICSYNKLTSLRGVSKNAKSIFADHNNISDLDYLPEGIQKLKINFNPIIITPEVEKEFIEKYDLFYGEDKVFRYSGWANN